jgi:hypothetical protein
VQDFGSGEVLMNFARGRWANDAGGPQPHPFRSLFPVHYWLNDFELSVQFPSTSDPSTRLVRGIPTSIYGIDDGQQYLKQIAPEALEAEPYCPFGADVFQVGWYLCELTVVSSHFSLPLSSFTPSLLTTSHHTEHQKVHSRCLRVRK